VGLRTGSHAIELSPPYSLAFIPVLGTDSIEIYTLHNGTLTHVQSSPSPRNEHDGPRHVKIHPNGKVLYCVTEHTNWLDVYTIAPYDPINPSQAILTYVGTRSLIPPHLRPQQHAFRGDTLLLSPPTAAHPAPQSIFATTRGAEESTRGWVGVWRLGVDGLFAEGVGGDDWEEGREYVERYEAPSSGGKAHALDLLVNAEGGGEGEGLWVLLTDDSPPRSGVRVLEWGGWKAEEGQARLREVSAWPEGGDAEGEDGETMMGGSHAVWLD